VPAAPPIKYLCFKLPNPNPYRKP